MRTAPRAEATPADGLRARQKADRRARMVHTALEMIDGEGFASVTVERIAERLGMSARTVHRYFPTKEDLVLAPVTDTNSSCARYLADDDGSRPLFTVFAEAIRHGLDELFTRFSDTRVRMVFRQVREVESVRARALLHNQTLQTELVSAVVARPDFGTDRIREAELSIAVFNAVVQTAQQYWDEAAPGGRTLGEEFDAALALLPHIVPGGADTAAPP
ncbi:TetR/AcrR family transcriptional regulator [Nocardiopsis ansamitocini]|uniref:TetR family transcriptional regulator n=1 Tax=Nocardiopsis ansamitocini TaxID=1670832 RepID=A0A9W6UKR6_9ACTN|nr:TetR/AcrR family transcriptional regulator [Nocardiopsis ansamitocini]GLU50269.1 TetR family transcriptional regulator [Nocardiopsis ansamitocini]